MLQPSVRECLHRGVWTGQRTVANTALGRCYEKASECISGEVTVDNAAYCRRCY
jgi:hypothetical protein